MSTTLRRWGPLAVLVVVAWGGVQLLQGWQGDRLGRQIAASAKSGDIVMLSSLSCPYCRQARDWFNGHRVAFSECFIESDANCAATYRAVQAPGTPTLLVRGKRQVGFDAERVARALSAG
jgi:glutaredoxin